jgi:hypothetical protein
MKTATIRKDNIANAALLGLTFLAIVGCIGTSNQAHAVNTPALETQMMEAIIVTAPRITPLVKMEAIVVTASRQNNGWVSSAIAAK